MKTPIHLVHLADSHLGFSAYNAINADGINQREADAMDAFQQAIDYCISAKPDLIVHAGDLFHTVSPTNRAMSFALAQLQRIEESKIHMYIASGNHETPKRSETGHAFQAFEEIFEYIHVSYPTMRDNDQIQTEFCYPGNLNTKIFMLPHCVNEMQLNEYIATINPDPNQTNILVTHGTSREIDVFKHNEYNEQELSNEFINNSGFDYIAMGHFHDTTPVCDKAMYSGSLFPLNFGESHVDKGLLDVHLKSSDDYPDKTRLETTFTPISTRRLITLPEVYAEGLIATEVTPLILASLDPSNAPDRSVTRIKVNGITPQVHKTLDFPAIRQATNRLLHCDIQYDFKGNSAEDSAETEIGPLDTELKTYLGSIPEPEPTKTKIIERSMAYYQEVTS